MLDIRFLNYPSVEKNNLVSVDVLMKFRILIIHYQQNIFVPKKIICHEQPFKKNIFIQNILKFSISFFLYKIKIFLEYLTNKYFNSISKIIQMFAQTVKSHKKFNNSVCPRFYQFKHNLQDCLIVKYTVIRIFRFLTS